MLREQKKQRMRQAISDVATRLFIEHGFEHVTIAQIADAAGVAKMTVTNHFPRKEDLVFDVHEEFAASLADAVGEPVLATMRQAYFDALERRDALLGFASRDFARLVASSDVLQARLRELHAEREARLAEVLAQRVDQLTARATAAQLAAAHRLLFDEVLHRIAKGERAVAKEVRRSAERVFDLLASGIR